MKAFSIFFLITIVFLLAGNSASATTICSSNVNQACSYTSDCSSYPSGTLCEKNVNGCGTSSSGNNVYSCVSGKWVYKYWTPNGSCNFCNVITPTSKPTPIPTLKPTPRPTLRPTPTTIPSIAPSHTPSATPVSAFLPADVDHHGCVNILGFNHWLMAFTGHPVPNTYPDINGDGKVDILDFNIWLSTIQSLYKANPHDSRLCLR